MSISGVRPAHVVLAVTIADAIVHYSTAEDVHLVHNKTAYVFGTMVGAPGRLDAWVELSPDGVNYNILGVVQNIAATGALTFPWIAHSSFMRVAVQAPVWAAGSWVVSVQFEGLST